MGAMSSRLQRHAGQRPAAPYDVDRDGFVIAGGAGMVVLEELERAKARGAKIYGEIVGYARQLRRLRHGRPVRRGRGALHAPGAGSAPAAARSTTSTRTAPARRSATSRRWRRCARCSATTPPLISSTKSLTGHSLGAAGAQEAIYCLLMMRDGFVAESANIETLDPAFADLPIVRERDRPAAGDGDVQQLRLRRHQRLPGDEPGRSCAERRCRRSPFALAANRGRSRAMADDYDLPKGELMAGKRGLVMGVANHNSIAWGIAAQLAAQGAELALRLHGDEREARAAAGREHRGQGLRHLRRLQRRLDGRRLQDRRGRLGPARLPGPRHRLRRPRARSRARSSRTPPATASCRRHGHLGLQLRRRGAARRAR